MADFYYRQRLYPQQHQHHLELSTIHTHSQPPPQNRPVQDIRLVAAAYEKALKMSARSSRGTTTTGSNSSSFRMARSESFASSSCCEDFGGGGSASGGLVSGHEHGGSQRVPATMEPLFDNQNVQWKDRHSSPSHRSSPKGEENQSSPSGPLPRRSLSSGSHHQSTQPSVKSPPPPPPLLTMDIELLPLEDRNEAFRELQHLALKLWNQHPEPQLISPPPQKLEQAPYHRCQDSLSPMPAPLEAENADGGAEETEENVTELDSEILDYIVDFQGWSDRAILETAVREKCGNVAKAYYELLVQLKRLYGSVTHLEQMDGLPMGETKPEPLLEARNLSFAGTLESSSLSSCAAPISHNDSPPSLTPTPGRLLKSETASQTSSSDLFAEAATKTADKKVKKTKKISSGNAGQSTTLRLGPNVDLTQVSSGLKEAPSTPSSSFGRIKSALQGVRSAFGSSSRNKSN